jgi:guanosine-3',5'-bis(diphosphate) 3'-pyrophosphohydrolase
MEELKQVLEAFSYAARKHLGHVRKDGVTPYAAHPARVAFLLAAVFGVKDAEVLAAAALHDTIEDTTADRDEIAERFGERVARYVAALSKDKRLPEEEREEAYFRALAAAPVEVKLCKLGDVLDNLLDAGILPRPERLKAARRARQLLELLEPGFPAEWAEVPARVRRQILAVEEMG